MSERKTRSPHRPSGVRILKDDMSTFLIDETASSEGQQACEEGQISAAPALVWEGAEYPRIDPGKYVVRGVSYQGPNWVRQFRRWSLRVEFALVHTPGSVSAFFNLGSDPKKWWIGRQSKYWKTWTLANGEQPRHGQQMSPEVFLEGQFFLVTVEDSKTDGDGRQKTAAEVYSRITHFHSVEWPQSKASNHESEIRNHAIT